MSFINIKFHASMFSNNAMKTKASRQKCLNGNTNEMKKMQRKHKKLLYRLGYIALYWFSYRKAHQLFKWFIKVKPRFFCKNEALSFMLRVNQYLLTSKSLKPPLKLIYIFCLAVLKFGVS